MDLEQWVEEIKKEIPTDVSGKWVALSDVHEILDRYLIPKWDHYSDLPSPSAYSEIKQHGE